MGVWWHALAFVTHERAKMSHKPGRNVTQAGPKCHTRAKMSHSHVIIFYIYRLLIIIQMWLRHLEQCRNNNGKWNKEQRWVMRSHTLDHMVTYQWQMEQGTPLDYAVICDRITQRGSLLHLALICDHMIQRGSLFHLPLLPHMVRSLFYCTNVSKMST